MYAYRKQTALSSRFRSDEMQDLLLNAGMDGVLGESWEDENGAIVATGFFTYLLGKPTPGDELNQLMRRACPYCAVPQSEAWLEYLKQFEHRTYTRYKMIAPAQFNAALLKALASYLPSGFSVRRIDQAMFQSGIVTEDELNIPHVFGNAENYLREGFGFAVLYGEQAVSIVSSYIVHSGKVEVDVATKADFRRRGLAAAVCARFILECMDKRLIPSWDAQNAESVRLARKLGFAPGESYDAYVLRG